jgi:hypothetical protein
MTTITLGSGPVAVEVENGASVPLTRTNAVTGPNSHGMVVASSVFTFLVYGSGTGIGIDRATGKPLDGGWPGIDLDALRKERAPKPVTVGGWSEYVPGGQRREGWLYDGERGGLTPHYWTLRPGNTPEKQAAFDAAMEALIAARDTDEDRTESSLYDALGRFIDAARALGYGRR